MDGGQYRYALEMLKQDGTLLGQKTIDPDWGPAREWASFEGIRRGVLPARMGPHPSVIEPIFDGKRGEPYVSGFRAVIHGGNGEAVSSDFPTSYFRSLAHEASTDFVKDGLLKAGELFLYRVCAIAVPAFSGNDRPTGRDGEAREREKERELELDFEEVVHPLPLDEVPLRSFMDARADGDPTPDGAGSQKEQEDFPVVIPSGVLDEVVELCRQAGDVEIGGVLVGKLHRDSEGGDIFVEVTAQIPAKHTLSETAKLTFTPETWSAVDAAITLRHQNEIILGWQHYHPNWCRNCPPEKKRECKGTTAFLSGQDVALHREIFSSAYHIALLVSASSTGELSSHLFGWRKGEVVARDFTVIGDQQQRGAEDYEQQGTGTTGRTGTAGTTETAGTTIGEGQSERQHSQRDSV